MNQNPFDQFDAPIPKPSANPFDKFDAGSPADTAAPPAEKSSALRRTLGDQVAVPLLKGIIGVPEAAVGIADLPTMGLAGRAVKAAGVDFKRAQDIASSLYSPEQQAANKRVAEADGVVDTLKAAAENPSVVWQQAVQNAPTMLAGGPVASGIRAAGAKFAPGLSASLAARLGEKAPIALGAASEGLISAGQNAEQVRQEEPNGMLSPGQSAILAASGVMTGGLAYGGGRLASKLGVLDPETMLAAGKVTTAGGQKMPGLAARVGGGFLSEGVLQEAPQSYQEQVAQNLAQGKPWDEGAANQAVIGGLVGGMMGAGSNLLPQAPAEDKTPPKPTPEEEQLLALPLVRRAGDRTTETPNDEERAASAAAQAHADAVYTARAAEEERLRALNEPPPPTLALPLVRRAEDRTTDTPNDEDRAAAAAAQAHADAVYAARQAEEERKAMAARLGLPAPQDVAQTFGDVPFGVTTAHAQQNAQDHADAVYAARAAEEERLRGLGQSGDQQFGQSQPGAQQTNPGGAAPVGEPPLNPNAGPAQRIGALAQAAGATPGTNQQPAGLAARAQSQGNPNAVQVASTAAVGTHAGGNEVAGRSQEGGGVGLQQQGNEPPGVRQTGAGIAGLASAASQSGAQQATTAQGQAAPVQGQTTAAVPEGQGAAVAPSGQPQATQTSPAPAAAPVASPVPTSGHFAATQATTPVAPTSQVGTPASQVGTPTTSEQSNGTQAPQAQQVPAQGSERQQAPTAGVAAQPAKSGQMKLDLSSSTQAADVTPQLQPDGTVAATGRSFTAATVEAHRVQKVAAAHDQKLGAAVAKGISDGRIRVSHTLEEAISQLASDQGTTVEELKQRYPSLRSVGKNSIVGGFHHEGRVYLVGKSLTSKQIVGVLYHEATHGRNNDRLNGLALNAIENRAKHKNPKARELLDRVARRMELAGEEGNAREALPYLVEVAAHEVAQGKGFSGMSALDGRVMMLIDRVSPALGRALREMVADIRAWALKHGFKFNPTVDDFLAIARGNAIDFGNEGATSGALAMSRSAYDQGNEEGGRGQDAGVLARRDDGVPQDAGQDRRGSGETAGAPQYGTARTGAVSAVARHYSKQQRDSLSGEFYGSGLYGEERSRAENSDDERLKSRIHFYVDLGSGIDPESGVGTQAHEVRLNNLYDVASGAIPWSDDMNAFESAILDAGYDGYLAPFGKQSAAVLLGPQHTDVPVRAIGNPHTGAAPQAKAAPTTLRKSLLSRELNAVKADNIPGARVDSGNLHVPAESRAAANAEMERIGSPVRFSIDALRDAVSLDNALTLAKQREWPKGRDLKEEIQRRVLEAAQAAGIDVATDSADTRRFLRDVGVRDALRALKQNPNAIGWYDKKTRQALKVMTLVHPEIGTDENARFAFTWALAVTSNGIEVGKNFELAEAVYRAYKRDGRMPTNMGIGTARKAINDALGLFNELRDAWGQDKLRRFMQTEFTVSEITGISKALKPGGEHADVTVRGSSILGPKIGNGFFSNLYGHFSALTMDRWLIRTWGRWTGTLLKPMPDLTDSARERMRAALREIVASPEESARLSDLIKSEITDQSDVDQLAKAVLVASQEPETREKLNASDVGLELRKAGNLLAKYLDGQKEAPSGPTERKYIRAVFNDILSELRDEHGYKDLTMADFQAVLWYAEKRLYETAKENPNELAADEDVDGYADSEAPDYANAAAEVARANGVTDRRINNALQGVENERSRGARSEAVEGDEGGQTAGAGQRENSREFTRQAKRFFIGERAVLRLRSDRAGDAQSPGSYERTSARDGGGVRVLKALGVSYAARWKISRKAGNVFRANELAAPDFLELAPSEENAKKFRDAISANKAALRHGAAVYVYDAADYRGMRLLLSEDGKSGVAIKPDGDIVSVFSTGGGGRAVMELAVAAGGRKLDAFDTVLPEFYAPHGFRAVARTSWNDDFAPGDWDKGVFKDFKAGEPDVVFMVYDPAKTDSEYSPRDGRRLTGDDSYTRAVAAQSREIRKLQRDHPDVEFSLDQNNESESTDEEVAPAPEVIAKRTIDDVPASFLLKHKVTIPLYDPDTNEYYDGEVSAAKALESINADIAATNELLGRVRKCLE